MMRILISSLIGLMLSGAAIAAPVLRADIVVNTPVVTVGDMFDDAGLAAEQPLFRSPLPGTSGVVSVTDIDAALSRVGIQVFQTNGIASVRVTRAAVLVDEALLTGLITQNLTERGIVSRGMSVNILLDTQLTPINAEAVAQPVTVSNLRYLPGSGAFTARFAIAGLAQPLDIAGSIELMIDVPHITSNMASGTVLTAANVEMRAVPLKFVEASGVAQLEDVVGMALVRQSREGMMLRPSDVTVPMLISKNDLVTIYFRKGAMTLTVKGQAVTSAASGGPVQVINLMSRRVITATAISAGAVEVTTSPLAVAGL